MSRLPLEMSLSKRCSPSRRCQPVTSHHSLTSNFSAFERLQRIGSSLQSYRKRLVFAINQCHFISKTPKRNGFQLSNLSLFPPSLPNEQPGLHLGGEEDEGGRGECDRKHSHQCCRHRPLLNSQGELSF